MFRDLDCILYVIFMIQIVRKHHFQIFVGLHPYGRPLQCNAMVTLPIMSNQFEPMKYQSFPIIVSSKEMPCSDICKFAFIWAAASFPGECNSLWVMWGGYIVHVTFDSAILVQYVQSRCNTIAFCIICEMLLQYLHSATCAISSMHATSKVSRLELSEFWLSRLSQMTEECLCRS